MKNFLVVVLLVTAIALSSCANPSKGQRGAGIGGASGALIGQAIGRNTEATLIGAAIGTVLGYIVGNEMDKYDRQQLNQAYEYGPSGQATTWRNPDNYNTYQVTPQPAYTPPQSPQTPCRRAEIQAVINGKTERTYTTACRNSAGQWELQN